MCSLTRGVWCTSCNDDIVANVASKSSGASHILTTNAKHSAGSCALVEENLLITDPSWVSQVPVLRNETLRGSLIISSFCYLCVYEGTIIGHAPCLEGLCLTCGVVVAGSTDVVVLVAAEVDGVVEGGGVDVSAIGVLDLIVAESWSKDNLSVFMEVQMLQGTCFNAVQWRCQVKRGIIALYMVYLLTIP